MPAFFLRKSIDSHIELNLRQTFSPVVSQAVDWDSDDEYYEEEEVVEVVEKTGLNLKKRMLLLCEEGEGEEEDDDMGCGLFDGDFDDGAPDSNLLAEESLGEKEKGREIKRNAEDLLMETISLQKTSGAFRWGQALEEATGFAGEEEARGGMPERCPSFECWWTALALAALETRMKEGRELWGLVADKARGFLEAEMAGKEERQALLEKAAAVVGEASK